MNIKQITARLDEIENRPRKSIFESIGRGDQYFAKWERDIHPRLCEVALAPEQIQQLFKSIETGRVEPTLDQPAATAPVVNTKDLLAQILKLTPAEQQQVLAHLKK